MIPPRMEWASPGPPRQEGSRGSVVGFWGYLSLTFFGQPQEQHVAVRASGPSSGWSHFELVVLSPLEAPKLSALPASQQGLCPWSPLASWGGLGPEQRCVGLSRRSRATHLGKGPEKGRGVKKLMTSPFVSSGLAPAPGPGPHLPAEPHSRPKLGALCRVRVQ